MKEKEYHSEEYISNLEKKIKILEKKLFRSEENRVHSQEMKEKTQILLTSLNYEINEANIIIQKEMKN